jgi:hypothetical protein
MLDYEDKPKKKKKHSKQETAVKAKPIRKSATQNNLAKVVYFNCKAFLLSLKF